MTFRDYRESAGLTQEGLGALAGLAETSISEFESGRRVPNSRSAAKICDALNGRLGTNLKSWDLWPRRFKNPLGSRFEKVSA